ncbi:MAG: HAD family hydrolase [Legionella sp.]|jgi:phosphoglycolate phosphatase-like HAD superfamily hydrolase
MQSKSELFSLLESGHAIVILDNDGTIFNSQPSEAWRIRAILAELKETKIPTIEQVLDIGYGKKVWADGLVDALKERFPSISESSLSALKSRLNQDGVDNLIVAMGKSMIPIPGAHNFLLNMNKNGNKVAICSDNYSDTVAEAVNHHISGVHCQLPDNRPAHKFADKKTKKPNDYLITLNDTMGIDLNGKYKPDPTKLLIQQFKALLELNVVEENQLPKFLSNSEFRVSLKSHANYRKTVYIGDDVNDYVAAGNANFDFFIASTNSGKCNHDEFTAKFESNKYPIEIISVDNLHMFNEQMHAVRLENKVKMQTARFFGANTETDTAANYREKKFEAANFDVAENKTLFSKDEFGHRDLYQGEEKTINYEQLQQILNYGQYIIMSAEDNPETKDWLIDYKAHLEKDANPKSSEKLALLDQLLPLVKTPDEIAKDMQLKDACETFRQEWNEISTQRLKKLLNTYGFRYTPVTGNYGKEERSFIVYTSLEGSQHIAEMTLTESIQSLEAMGRFFKQDSILISRFGSNVYLYTYGPDKGKIAYGELYNLVPPKQEYSSWVNTKTNTGEDVEQGFALSLDWEKRHHLSMFLKDCDNSRAKMYEEFSFYRLPTKPSNDYREYLIKLAGFRLDTLVYEVNQTIALMDSTKADKVQIENIKLDTKIQQGLKAYLTQLLDTLKSEMPNQSENQLNRMIESLNTQTPNCRTTVALINDVINLIQRNLKSKDLVLEEKTSASNNNSSQKHHKMFVLTRGIKDYNELTEALKNEFEARGLKVQCISSDAHIHQIATESPWLAFETEVVPEMIKRNTMALQHFLNDPNVDVVIYSDMNRNMAYMKPHVTLAKEKGFTSVAVQSNYNFDAKTDPYYLKHHEDKAEFKNQTTLEFDATTTIAQIIGPNTPARVSTLADTILKLPLSAMEQFDFDNDVSVDVNAMVRSSFGSGIKGFFDKKKVDETKGTTKKSQLTL